jgi:hypothetical protein
MNRDQLKDIVKECLMEILLEGLDSGNSRSPIKEGTARARQRSLSPRRNHLDSTAFTSGAARVADMAQGRRDNTQHVTQLAASVASGFDPKQRDIMQGIFEDTIRNTLPTQVSADTAPGAAHAGPIVNADPMDLFEGASNWADLAFAPAKKS